MKTYVKKSKLGGKGLFAKTDIKKGEVIGIFKGTPTNKEHIHTLWYNDKEGIRVTNNMKYSNHDFINPNATLSEDNALRSLRDIKKDEEICWDYSVGHKYSSAKTLKPLLDNQKMSVLHYAIMDADETKFNTFLKHYLKKYKTLRPIEKSSLFDDPRIYHSLSFWVAYHGTPNMMVTLLKKGLVYKKDIPTLLSCLIFIKKHEILNSLFDTFNTVYGEPWDYYFHINDNYDALPSYWISQHHDSKTIDSILNIMNKEKTHFVFDYENEIFIHDYILYIKDKKLIKNLALKMPQAFFFGYMRTHGNTLNKIKVKAKINKKEIDPYWIDYWFNFNNRKTKKFIEDFCA